MLSKFKDMYKLQKQGKQIKKDLHNTHIEAESEGIIVIVNGEQEIIDIKIPEEMMKDQKKLTQALIKALSKALKKSQQIAAEKMKGIMGQMGLGNFPGV